MAVAAGPQHAMELADRARCLGHVVDDAIGVDEVERRVGIGEVGDRTRRRGLRRRARAAGCASSSARGLKSTPVIAGAGAHELGGVGAHAAPRLEDVLARPTLEADDLRNVGFERVAARCYLREEPRGAGGACGPARARLIARPERAPVCVIDRYAIHRSYHRLTQ